MALTSTGSLSEPALGPGDPGRPDRPADATLSAIPVAGLRGWGLSLPFDSMPSSYGGLFRWRFDSISWANAEDSDSSPASCLSSGYIAGLDRRHPDRLLAPGPAGISVRARLFSKKFPASWNRQARLALALGVSGP